MRICPRCERDLPETLEFWYKDSHRKNGLTTYCKPCTNTKHEEYYATHTEYEAKRAARRYAERRAWLDSLKDAPCMDCGHKYPAVCMDWDHVRGTKITNLAAMTTGQTRKDRILEEIAKCDLVCSNCHRIRTAERGMPDKRKYDRSAW